MKYIKHYQAACRTINVSPEAAAAMARRCLEEVLLDQGYKQFNISQKIEALLNESDPKKHLPLEIHQCVDQIRTFGNFSAHPLSDKTSLQIVDVEHGEAEWCLEILETLFEHYFERPAAMAARIAAANANCNPSGDALLDLKLIHRSRSLRTTQSLIASVPTWSVVVSR